MGSKVGPIVATTVPSAIVSCICNCIGSRLELILKLIQAFTSSAMGSSHSADQMMRIGKVCHKNTVLRIYNYQSFV